MTVHWHAPTDTLLDHCMAKLPVDGELMSVGWKRIEGRIVPDIALPIGWSLK